MKTIVPAQIFRLVLMSIYLRAICWLQLSKKFKSFLWNLFSSNTDGVSLAKQLRSQNRDAIIIFITDNDKCAIEGYKVQAFRYILKSKWKEEFNDLMDALVSRLYIESQSIKLKTDEGEEIIPIKNIIYIEGAGGRKTLLHTTINSEPLECRSSLSNLGENPFGQGLYSSTAKLFS